MSHPSTPESRVSTPAGNGGRPSDGPRLRNPVVRGLALLVVLGIWLGVAGVGGPLVGRLSEVQKNDSASFLPDSAESTRAAVLAEGFDDSTSLPFFLVADRDGGLRPGDLQAVTGFVQDVPGLAVETGDGPATVGDYLTDDPLVPVPSEDGAAVLTVLGLDAEKAATNLPNGESVVYATATALRDAVDDRFTDGLEVHLTGPGGFTADLVTAFRGIDGTLLQVTLAVVFVILLLVYRSPLLPFAVMLSSLFALSAAGAVVYVLADRGAIVLDGQSQGILFILVVGAATDYALLLVARYREELRAAGSKYAAMRRAWRATVEPVAASAATVVVGLLCLLLADLGSTRGLGPVGAIGIAASVLSVLTFLPVLLLLPVIVLLLVAGAVFVGVGAALAGVPGAAAGAVLVLVAAVAVGTLRVRSARHGTNPRAWYNRAESGRWLFWPRVPRSAGTTPGAAASGVWHRVAELVGSRPRTVWLVTLAGLLVLAAFVPTFQAQGTSQADIFRHQAESVTGQEVLAEHFPAGSGNPVLVVAPAAELEDVLAVLEGTEGVAEATVTTAGPPGVPADPLVVDGAVEVRAVLTEDAGTTAAEDVVLDLRERLQDVSSQALVGGSTASNLDVRQASYRDLRVIVPVVLVVIFLVLVLLLRSIVAPVVLLVANVVSFAATIGAAAIVFNHVLDLPGADPQIPLYGFVFLVALSIDYSIFLMTRVREESGRQGTRRGILTGLTVTGGVITSAGVVLAATFSALVTLPLLFLLQIAFIVAFGVLLDTFIVRSLLVPALSYDLGDRLWAPRTRWSPLARSRT